MRSSVKSNGSNKNRHVICYVEYVLDTGNSTIREKDIIGQFEY